jgi:thiamine-phosphate pyrophosphorylase
MREMGENRRCQIIALIPLALLEDWAANFDALIAPLRPAALIIESASDEPRARAALQRLAASARAANLALLLVDGIEQAASLGLTGVHLAARWREAAQARSLLGSSAIIGAECPASRHEGMIAAEAGADYAAFLLDPANPNPVMDLTRWWSEVIEIPVALVCNDGIPAAELLEEAGADFVIARERVQAGESLRAAKAMGLAASPSA